MSRFPQRTASALVIVDAQQHFAEQIPGSVNTLVVMADLVARARLAAVPVIWLRRVDAALRVGEPGWQLADELTPIPGETLIDHRWDDGFIDTDLAGELEAAEAGQLWLAGLGSDHGVLQTYLGAVHRGWDVTLIEDAHLAAPARFDDCDFSGRQLAAFVNRMVWLDLDPDVTGNLVAAANVDFGSVDEPDDLDLISQAEQDAEDDSDLGVEIPGQI